MLKAMVARLLTAIVLITPVVMLIGGGVVPPGVSWT
ncbi:hypothetical protein SAMN05444920_14329 [Nonomuraea solani]|uniref:Uncharacterized protein n=1 Tax=Nonomuraea solani TaxID=1144553 RepID=A0A1H6F0U4_9ACTN|nr:hypothetical protein SAMN05444920_14329 [Nonomuraea solani]